MKESVRRIQQDGYSKLLLELVNRWRIQKSCIECIIANKEHAYVAFFNSDGLCWYHEGIMEKSSSLLLEVSVNGVIEVNVDSHALLRVNGEEVNGVEHNQVLDLNDDGERWEGDVLDDEPYGWGVLYDSENRMTYEGFRIGEVSVCYGTQYYSDVGVIEYEGMICEGKRWGRGVQYDRTGKVMYKGEWMNNEQMSKRVVLSEENQLLHNHVEELIVSDKSCNGREWTDVDFSVLTKLRELRVGDCCFRYVEEVKLVGLKELERVEIGKNSFTWIVDWHQYYSERHFYLKNCERLRELKMGCGSFGDYSVCEIENVPSLEVIEMGELNVDSYSFWDASLELKSGYERMNMMNRLAQVEITSIW